MCPQLNLLNKHNLLTTMRNLLLSNLTNNIETSHELKQKIRNTVVMKQLETILNTYPPSGFKESASFIGAVCSDLSNQGLVKHSMKRCLITRKTNDAFRI